MSAYDNDLISAEDSYIHYTEVRKKQSHSVWGLSCSQTDECGVPGSPDPLDDAPAHAKVDFTGKSETQMRKIAKRLKVLAIARGCLHPAL